MSVRRTTLKYDIVDIVVGEFKSSTVVGPYGDTLGGRWKQLEIAVRVANRILTLEYFDGLNNEYL